MSNSAIYLKKTIKENNIKQNNEWMKRKVVPIILWAVIPYVYILAALLVSRYFNSTISMIFAFALLLAAQRCFQVLVHDSAHFFYSSKQRRNDLLGNFLSAGFIGMSVPSYRKVHFEHHKNNGSVDDPEFISMDIIRAQGGLLKLCITFLLGLRLVELIRKYYLKPISKDGNGLENRDNFDWLLSTLKLSHVLICQVALFTVFLFADVVHFYLIWIYLAVSVSPLLSRLRFLVEHPERGETTMTTLASIWELVFFAPNSFNYHFEHHCWPSVPPYKLRKVHKELANKDFFRSNPGFVGSSFIKPLIKRN